MTFRYRYRKQIVFTLIIISLICAGIPVYNNFSKDKKSDDKSIELLHKVEKKETKSSNKKEEKKQEVDIMIDVKGEVTNPGIYTLKQGSRVIDAINIAGGITNNADTSILNLSKKLEDEMVIIVYSYYEVRNIKETKQKEEQANKNCVTYKEEVNNDACIVDDNTTKTTDKISINTADTEELMTLPGIGESKAKSIIEYRDSNGLFENIEDIKNVSGIGDSLFEKIKEHITL